MMVICCYDNKSGFTALNCSMSNDPSKFF